MTLLILMCLHEITHDTRLGRFVLYLVNAGYTCVDSSYLSVSAKPSNASSVSDLE